MNTPWEIDDSEFYEVASREEELRFLLQYAILAPSSHNTQPWQFRITPEGIEVLPDFSRRLPIVDPLDRELWLSIGAAITNLRAAAAHFGFGTTVLYSVEATLVRFQETGATDEELRALFPALKQRHTNRNTFLHEPFQPRALKRLCDLIDQYPDTLRLLLSRDCARVADLVSAAEREQMAQPPYREELADWIRPNEIASGDGMPADAIGFATPIPGAIEWVVRHVDVGAFQAARDHRFVEAATALIVVAAEDDQVSLIRAGETLERFLLRVTLEDLHYSFFNSPVELPLMRERLWTLSGSSRPPQLLLRIGRAQTEVHPTPRRPLEAVVHKNG